MKKILLMSLLVISCNQLFALVSQGHWRWRNDDGSEQTATWMAAQDEAVTISDASKNIRLRFELYNDATDPFDPLNGELQYRVQGGSEDDWVQITNDAGTNAFVFAGTSPFVTDLEATTQQITGLGLTFQSGKVLVSTVLIPTNELPPSTETEYEYCIKPTANIQTSTTYEFRVEATNHNPGFTNPVLTTAAVLPVTFTSFSVQEKGKGVQISWSTGTEENNDHFVVQRSVDARVWNNLATVLPGKITANHDYGYFDASPLTGKNYYRILQVDKDGRTSTTSIKDIVIKGNKAVLMVRPNPVTDQINLTVSNYDGIATITLYSMDGKTILRQQVNISNTGNNITIPLYKKPIPGNYLVSVTGSGMKETIQVYIK